MCTRTSLHLATFTRRPGSTLYTLTTTSPQVAASGLCLPYRPRLPRPAFLASRGGSSPLLTPPHLPRRKLPCRLSTLIKGEVPDILIPWIRADRLELRGGSARTFLSCICTLTEVQNGVAERRIGLVMEFYHPTSRRVLPSQDVTFDESVTFYHLFLYRTAPLPPLPLFLAPDPPLLVDFAAACCLDYATSLVAESASDCPPSVGGKCALGTDVLEDTQEDLECLAAALPHVVAMLLAHEGDPDVPDIPTPRSYAEAITGPYSSHWQTSMDAEMASLKSTSTYRQGVDFFQTFSPTPKMTTLRVLLHVAAQRDYELHSLDFSTAFLQGSMHEEIWLHRPPGFTGMMLAALGFAASIADPSLFLRTDTWMPPFYILVYIEDLFFATAYTDALALVNSELQKRHTCTDLGEQRSYLGFHITRDRAQCTITLSESHMVHQVLQCFGFRYSSPKSTPLPTGHSLSAPPSNEFVEPSGPYPELVGCLMYLMTCTQPDLAYPLSILARYVAPGRHRPEHWEAAKRVLRNLCSASGMGLVLGGRGPVVLTGHTDASWVDDLATQRSSQGYTFSLGSGSISWRSTRSSSVLSSNSEAEIYAGAMAAKELRWLTYLLTDLGERPCSPPVMYVDNKAVITLCQEHRLEHWTKHIARRYFLARELQ
ncbi:unnamed protein product [Closterium sp. NIES-53]